jgi:fucose 4-O-acetylase-like acetyltransferase
MPTFDDRVLWIDAAKGLGISLIAFGHIWSLSNPPLIYWWLFSFHVPLFFFISGITLKIRPDSVGAALMTRAKRLLVPYFWYAGFGYLLYLAGYVAARGMSEMPAQFDYGLWVPLLGILHGTAGDGYLVNSPLWFLPALLVSFSLAYLINALVPALALRIALTLIIMAVGLAINDQIRLPFSIVPGLIALGFLQAGYWFGQTQRLDRLNKKQALMIAVLLLLASLISPINGAVGLAGATVNNPLLFVLFAAIGIGMCTLGVYCLPRGLQHLLARVGRYSLIILVTHMLIIKGIKVSLQIIMGWNFATMESHWGQGSVVLVLTVIGLLVAVPLINRFAPFTLGPGQR